ncbi:MAG: formate--tetrahydrofolate ligase [Verrucomicrobia bacterium]|nr:formate--tetrahydrofolate ligase [Verrucomicrobiota bacterium]
MKLRPITSVAKKLGLTAADLELYGTTKAKIATHVADRVKDRPPGKLVIVTAITPTPAGEGKTTISIGLSMALWKLGKTSCLALREPSLGPLFGLKGGATGGGKATVQPAEDINLHFTGDLHAVTSAQNLLASLLDNHIFNGNALGIDPASIQSRRALDICDRSLRNILIQEKTGHRYTLFELTAACEIMATLVFAKNLADAKERLGRIVVGFTHDGKPVTATDLKAVGALTAIVRDALKPNLVQTAEGTPAIIHLGPFANVASGCNSLAATRLARQLAEFTITEGGFASDLGFEKFCDLICRAGGFAPDAAVVVATVRALKYHGGMPLKELGPKNLDAVTRGFENLRKHIENIQAFGLPCIVALNHFVTDHKQELALVQKLCAEAGATCVFADVWAKGGRGGTALAEAVIKATSQPNKFKQLYEAGASIPDKIAAVARAMYGADDITLMPAAQEKVARLESLGLDKLPVCIAKSHLSLSDNAKLLNRPRGFTVTIRDLRLMAGAGYIVCYAGDIMTMPGLPKVPAAERAAVADDGTLTGLMPV